MTPKQVANRLEMMRYVSEWSEDFGKVDNLNKQKRKGVSPDLLIQVAEKKGIHIPEKVKSQLKNYQSI